MDVQTGKTSKENKIKTVILKNGTEEVMDLVTITYMSLGTLLDEHPLAFYGLVKKM